jgi:hypothetical protein
MLTDLLKSKMFNVIFSVVLGIGLICLFRPQCKGDDCKQTKAPPITEWDGMTYRMGSKCYTYTSEITECPTQGVIESFETQFRNRDSAIRNCD